MNVNRLRQSMKVLPVFIVLGLALGLFANITTAQAMYELEPVALCVRDLGENANPRYEAHFGYRNNTEFYLDVVGGITGMGINELTGGSAQPFLPESFDPGQSADWPDSVFYVAFDSGSVTWTLGTINDLNNGAASAFVSEFSARCGYHIIVDKIWIDANGQGTFIPPLDLTPEWRLDMVAFDSNGQATGAFGNCIYLLPDPTLRCAYVNPNSNVVDRLIVPEGGSYEVAESPSLAPEWVPADPSGLGHFNPVTVYCETPYNNDASECYHLVRNQAGLEAGRGTLIINKFHDVDGDGVQGDDETLIDGFTFNVANENGSVAGSPFVTSGGTTGQINLPAGAYIVSENTPNQCWIQTAGPSGSVFVADNATTTVVFGNYNTCTTPTETPTETVTATEPPTETVTPTETPTETVTATEPPTETVTPTETPTETVTATEPPTETVTPTEPPTETVTPTETPTETVTATEPPTETVTPTETPTETVTPTEPPTETVTPTETPTETVTATEPPTETVTATEPPTETVTPTETPTETVTATEPPTETVTPTSTPDDDPLGCQRNNPERLDCSSLEVTAVCDGSTAVFTITNTGEAGDGDMRAPTEYRLIVNGVVVETGSVQIAGGTSMTVTYSGGGSVTLEADQQVGHPGHSQPQATVNCGTGTTPTETPSETPTVEPTVEPTIEPTVEPTPVPTEPLGCQSNNPERLDCSSLQVTTFCSGSVAVFNITNTGEAGEGDMRAPTEYRLLVNGVVVETGSVQLAGATYMTVTYSGSGTITLQADQQVGHPGRSQPQATINCSGSTTTTGGSTGGNGGNGGGGNGNGGGNGAGNGNNGNGNGNGGGNGAGNGNGGNGNGGNGGRRGNGG